MSTSIIKKPFMCVALVMVLLIGMAMPAFANSNSYYVELEEGITLRGNTLIHGEDGTSYSTEIKFSKYNDIVNLKFKDIKGNDVKIELEESDNGSEYFYNYGNKDTNTYFSGRFNKVASGEYHLMANLRHGNASITEIYIRLDVEESKTQTLSTMFSGNTTSKWGEYDVALSGRIKGDFKEGVNELTVDQIKEQTISAVVYNNFTDEIVTRNVNQITGIKVTVKDGKIVNVELDGKARTTEGRADTFNAKIDL